MTLREQDLGPTQIFIFIFIIKTINTVFIFTIQRFFSQNNVGKRQLMSDGQDYKDKECPTAGRRRLDISLRVTVGSQSFCQHSAGRESSLS